MAIFPQKGKCMYVGLYQNDVELKGKKRKIGPHFGIKKVLELQHSLNQLPLLFPFLYTIRIDEISILGYNL